MAAGSRSEPSRLVTLGRSPMWMAAAPGPDLALPTTSTSRRSTLTTWNCRGPRPASVSLSASKIRAAPGSHLCRPTGPCRSSRQVTASQGMWSGAISGGFVQLANGSSLGVDGQITINLDSIAAGDKLRFNAAYGDNPFIGGGNAARLSVTRRGRTMVGALSCPFQHMWSSTLKSGLTYSYLMRSGGLPSAWTCRRRLGVDALRKASRPSWVAQYIVDNANTTAASWTGLISLAVPGDRVSEHFS